MNKLNPAFLKAMADRVNECPYYVHTSMEIKEKNWENGLLWII